MTYYLNKGSEIQIKNISIRNIKCFNDIKINFQQKSNIIIGINGRGKTTILQLLALGLTDEIKPNTKNEWIDVIKMGSKIGEFEITVIIDKNEKVFRYKINKKDEISCIENREELKIIFSSYLILAYGTNRGVLKSEFSNKIKYEDIASLFNDNGYFKNIGQTGVYEFVKNNFIKIQDIINDIFIGSDSEFLLNNFTKETFLFKTPTAQKNNDLLKLEAMPSGFRVMFIWIFDMIWRASEIYHIEIGDKNNFRGIVLIDEIDKHLHPSWQRRILPILNINFPNIQFVFTTHSPFIVQSLENDSLTILKTKGDGTTIKKLNIKGKPFGYEIEKIIERIMGENEIPEISVKLKGLLIDIKEAVKEKDKQKVTELHSKIINAVPEDSDYIDRINILLQEIS